MQASEDLTRMAVSPAEASRVSGLGRSTIYVALSKGELKSLKIGKRRLIMTDELRRYLLAHESPTLPEQSPVDVEKQLGVRGHDGSRCRPQSRPELRRQRGERDR
jgi:excisionase family DNA binding protein